MKLHDYINSLHDKRVTVVGIGISNRPLIELLAENGIDVTACDKRSAEKLGDYYDKLVSLGVKLKLGEAYLDDIEADVIFRTPGLHPLTDKLSEAVSRGAVLTSEMETFFEVCPCRIVAVTGSDGKTTTTSVIAEMLRRGGYTVHIGGNIGHPLLCEADSMKPEDIAVLELSSFQLMTMNVSPDVAVVTNVAPNHLDIHRSMDEYVDAKKNVFAHQNKNCRVVLNMDNDITNDFAGEANGSVMMFSRRGKPENGAYWENGSIFIAKNGETRQLMDSSEIFLPGVHNIENYMAAFCAVQGYVTDEVCVQTAKEFTGVEHRIEYVRTVRGVKYYNDSIASSPSRTIAGLRSFTQKLILIAGGKDKGVPFDVLGPEIIEHVKTLVLTGFTAEKLRDTVMNTEGYNGSPEIYIIDGFKDAVLEAQKHAQKGDIVILSPACTSFDRFANFEERGNTFKAIVNELE